ncbi:MAG TPA: hypothetical protein PLJ21_09675 [Pseudobdellovibrionaceae bacterium]|nr:hypothetical protein [Pseudobdellovibrionaceae bacterium]
MGINAHSANIDADLDNDLDLDIENDVDSDEEETDTEINAAEAEAETAAELLAALGDKAFIEEDDDHDLNEIENILDLEDTQFPKFTLAKNKARFLRMVSWYRTKEDWIEVAPLSGVTKLFKQQTKELEGIRSSKLDYEMELETGTLTPSQRSYRRDELKMCRVQEKMAVHLISKLQLKIKTGRR